MNLFNSGFGIRPAADHPSHPATNEKELLLDDFETQFEHALVPAPAEPRTILVNGAEHLHQGDRIDLDQVTALAFPGVAAGAGRSLTACWHGGPAGADRGVVPFGSGVPVIDGQRFDVFVTDKS